MSNPSVDETTARALSAQLFEASRQAQEHGLHETAYHALCASMHAAQSAKDSAAVSRIADEAREQIDWIDRHAPRHRLSTSSAKRRDHPGVYAMLERQAEMVARMLEQQEPG